MSSMPLPDDMLRQFDADSFMKSALDQIGALQFGQKAQQAIQQVTRPPSIQLPSLESFTRLWDPQKPPEQAVSPDMGGLARAAQPGPEAPAVGMTPPTASVPAATPYFADTPDQPSGLQGPVERGGDLRAYARAAAQRAGVNPDIFERQINQESGFNPGAYNPSGASGIAQIVPQYHPGVDTSDPYASLDYAANLMASHLKTYGGDYSKALAAYNAGPGNVETGAYLEFPETQTYLRNILQGQNPQAAQALPESNPDLNRYVNQRVPADVQQDRPLFPAEDVAVLQEQQATQDIPDQPSGLTKIPETSDTPTFPLPPPVPESLQPQPRAIDQPDVAVPPLPLATYVGDTLSEMNQRAQQESEAGARGRDAFLARIDASDLPVVVKATAHGMESTNDIVRYLNSLLGSSFYEPFRDRVIKPLLASVGAEHSINVPGIGEIGTADIAAGFVPGVNALGGAAHVPGMNVRFPAPSETILGAPIAAAKNFATDLAGRVASSEPVRNALDTLGTGVRGVVPEEAGLNLDPTKPASLLGRSAAGAAAGGTSTYWYPPTDENGNPLDPSDPRYQEDQRRRMLLGAVAGAGSHVLGRGRPGQGLTAEPVPGPLPRLPRIPPLPPGTKPITAGAVAEVERLRLDKFPEEIRDTIKKAAEGVDWAREQRRGIVPDVVSEKMADDLGRSVEKWISLGKAGRAYNAEETRALRNAITAQGGHVADLSSQIAEAEAAGVGTNVLLARFGAESTKLRALVQVAEGARAEAGRSMRAYQTMTRSVDANPNDVAARLAKKIGDRDQLAAAIGQYQEMVKDGANPIQLANFWGKVEQGSPGFTDWLIALRYNSMLSGPRTFEVNAISNALEVPWRLVRDVGASTLRGRPEELAPELSGLYVGALKGAQAAMEVLRFGITSEQAAAGDLPRSLSNRVSNPVGKAVAHILEVPGSLLQATDEFARQAAYGMNLGREAAMQASKEGLQGAAWSRRVAEGLSNPTEQQMARAFKAAQRMTYQNEMGGVGQWMMRGRQDAPLISNIVLPFLRTVYNITARGLDRSPVGIIGTGIDVARGAYKNGQIPKGASPLGERLGDNIMGGLAGLWFVSQATQGNITGSGPDDVEKRAMMRSQGWQPYSIKVGDNWVSYANWGPVSLPLAMAAASAESQRYGEPDDTVQERAISTFKMFAQLFTEQTYLQAIGSVYRSISDPVRYGSQWLTSLVGSVIPYGSALNTIGQMTDESARKPENLNIEQAVEARLPVLRQQVPEAQDVLGRTAPNLFAGTQGLSPLRVSPTRPEPVLQAFQAAGVDIGRPADHITFNTSGRAPGQEPPKFSLSPAEQQQWNTLRGQALQDIAGKTINDSRYLRANEAQQQDILHRLLDLAREQADKKMIERLGRDEIRRRLSGAA